MKKPKQEIDRPITQLIRDLEKRGLVEPILVTIDSEFCRDMIESIQGSNAKDQSRLSRRPLFQKFTTMDISPKTACKFEKRLFFLTKEVMGKPAMDIFT